MSDAPNFNPYELGTPEFDRFNAAALRGIPLGALTIPAATAALVLPAGGETSDVTGYIPGAATGLYGAFGQLIPKFLNWSYGTNLPPAPGAKKASELAEQSIQNALELTGADKAAKTPEEHEFVDAIAHVPVIPMLGPSITNAISKLPLAARIPAKTALFASGALHPEAVPIAAAAQSGFAALPGIAEQINSFDPLDYMDKNTGFDPLDYMDKNQSTAGAGGPATVPFQYKFTDESRPGYWNIGPNSSTTNVQPRR